ncbi:hypothetical protein WJX77_007889 [Trebouxia sp. C0004]
MPAASFAVAQLPKLAWPALPAAFNSLSSWQCVVEGSAWLMGRRDKRTCKGKVFKGSSGNARSKKPRQPSLQWQRQQQQTAASQKPMAIPYPPRKPSMEEQVALPSAGSQLAT